MRKFKLINANGQEFDLMRKDAFFNEPDGLGWGLEAETMAVGDTYIVTDRTPEKPSPAGDMVFLGYEQYREFLLFVQVGGLVLAYKPLDVWQYLDVDLTVGKSEIEPETNRLICPVSFAGSSQWYEQLKVYQSQSGGGTGKVYSYTYPYTYKNAIEAINKIKSANIFISNTFLEFVCEMGF